MTRRTHSQQSDDAGRAITVLLIDDDADLREAMASVLEENGCQVVVAGNGQQALERLRLGKLRPTLILLDLMMPVMDGWKFRDVQRGDPQLADIPIVVVSAYSNVRAEAQHIGAAAWLKKPVELATLLRTIRSIDC
jgi:CheY-like chemotaxis protein